jgi:CheY-like chemotaxis protein
MKTILVVDDDYDLLSVITAFLESEGFLVVGANNGKAGLNLLKSRRPDLVLTDFMMPCSGGADLVRRLRGTSTMHETPVVMMSAMHPCEGLPELTEQTTAFLQKPFRCDELLRQVVDLIGTP